MSGYVIDQFKDHKQGLIWGYRLVLAWNVFTLVFLMGATLASWLNFDNLVEEEEQTIRQMLD